MREFIVSHLERCHQCLLVILSLRSVILSMFPLKMTDGMFPVLVILSLSVILS